MVPPAVEEKLLPVVNPWLPVPVPPTIWLIAVTEPVVEKAPPKIIPWLGAPEPPVQAVKVTSPEVPVVHAAVVESP